MEENTQPPVLKPDDDETQAWIEATIASIPAFEKETLEGNLEISKLIEMGTKVPDKLALSIDFNGVVIRVRAFMSKKMRNKILLADRMMKAAGNDQAEVDRAEGQLYEALGMVCLDAPYDNKTTWAYLDYKGAPVMMVFEYIIQKIVKGDKQLRDFRKK